MTFGEYQQESWKTAIYPYCGGTPVYPALGLAGEAGEVCEQIKKSIRDDRGIITPERKLALTKELGDVLWYLAALATELNLSLEHIARQNLDKLCSRQERGVLHGSGDDR
ncbi:MAG: nucleoside triphosphate pyrophosphohydrolase family protein [Deltaproteobacteria bacterium]|nr:nucleoside triphosphate pyrophosphohydrolase family protein [Deltaproteobacteria bacterium]